MQKQTETFVFCLPFYLCFVNNVKRDILFEYVLDYVVQMRINIAVYYPGEASKDYVSVSLLYRFYIFSKVSGVDNFQNRPVYFSDISLVA